MQVFFHQDDQICGKVFRCHSCTWDISSVIAGSFNSKNFDNLKKKRFHGNHHGYKHPVAVKVTMHRQLTLELRSL